MSGETARGRDHRAHAEALVRGHVPGGPGDSAGVPWAGRELRPTGFEGDAGEADAGLERALAAWRTVEASDAAAAMTEAEEDVVAALAGARLLVPVVAVEEDGGADMAVVTLTAPDGTRAMPVFSSVTTLGAWRRDARPVPVVTPLAVQAAFSEGCEVMLLDLGPESAPFVVRPSMLWALGEGRTWRGGWSDGVVRAAVASAVAGEPDIRSVDLSRGGDGATTATLTLAPGLPRETVAAVLTRVGERVAREDEARLRLDGLGFRLEQGS